MFKKYDLAILKDYLARSSPSILPLVLNNIPIVIDGVVGAYFFLYAFLILSKFSVSYIPLFNLVLSLQTPYTGLYYILQTNIPLHFKGEFYNDNIIITIS